MNIGTHALSLDYILLTKGSKLHDPPITPTRRGSLKILGYGTQSLLALP